jgi:trehalose/maltose hydrolase-like predicted phosphorylase
MFNSRWLVPLAAVALVGSQVIAAAPAAAHPGPPRANDPWVLSSSTYDNGDFTRMPFVGNGYLGQRLPAIGEGYQGDMGPSGYQLDQIPKQRMTSALVAGVYNKGLTSSVPAMEYIASLPTWSTMTLGVAGQTLTPTTAASQVTGYQQSVDLRRGLVTTSLTWTPAQGMATSVSFEVLANRANMHLGQVRMTVTPNWTGTLSLSALLDGGSTQGINPISRAVDTAADTATVLLRTPGANTTVAETQKLVVDRGVTVSGRGTETPADNTATAGEDWSIPVTAGASYVVTKYVGISTSNDAGDPATVAANTVTSAAHTGWAPLLAQHVSSWAGLWAPNVTVAGDNALLAATNMSYYTLYSSVRAGLAWSIPPAGLTSQDYNGDIFWDADTWMFPTLLALHPELARSIVQFRADTIGQAEADAAANGYRGAIWAWDNGPDGACGDLGHPMCVGYEDHLESDIALAQWQYYEATGDTAWLRSDGYPVLRDVAEFWASRATLGSDGKYHINGVTGPDEYTAGVNDESATNAGAVIALRDATAAARVIGAAPDPGWTSIADLIAVPVDQDGSHPEYAGYTGETVKQADTVLMTYPFQYVTDPASVSADLNRYMPVTDPNGPAMTNSVESIIAAQAQQPGCLDYTLFQNSYQPYLNGPYDQFSETQGAPALSGGGTGPAFDFATGAGGFLQTYVYGFAGLRWNPTTLVLAPTLPPQLAGGVTITGLHYQGRTLTVAVGATNTTVTLNSGPAVALTTPNGSRQLTTGRPVTVPTARPDRDPTDDLARCQAVTTSSAASANPPSAAVDGNPVTNWAATDTTSTYQVTLAHPDTTSNAHISWGRTRPAGYTASVLTPSRNWQQVGSGTVPAVGDLDIAWPAVTATAVRFAFSGGNPASITRLTVPNGKAADVVGTLSGAAATAPGHPVVESLTLHAIGATDAHDVTSHLTVPAGWSVTDDPAPVTIRHGGQATVHWTVTPPANQPTTAATVAATTSWTGVNATDTTAESTVLDVVTPVALGSTMDAENGALSGGAVVANDHSGYTGSGFVAGLYAGATDAFLVHVPAAGTYTIAVRYANSWGGQQPPLQNVTRTISLTTPVGTQQLSLPVTGSWDTWATVTTDVTLPAGDDIVELSVGPNDSGSVNIDNLIVS